MQSRLAVAQTGEVRLDELSASIALRHVSAVDPVADAVCEADEPRGF